jgi:hypothetical protein
MPRQELTFRKVIKTIRVIAGIVIDSDNELDITEEESDDFVGVYNGEGTCLKKPAPDDCNCSLE